MVCIKSHFHDVAVKGIINRILAKISPQIMCISIFLLCWYDIPRSLWVGVYELQLFDALNFKPNNYLYKQRIITWFRLGSNGWLHLLNIVYCVVVLGILCEHIVCTCLFLVSKHWCRLADCCDQLYFAGYIYIYMQNWFNFLVLLVFSKTMP